MMDTMQTLQHPDRKIIMVWRFKYYILLLIDIIAHSTGLAVSLFARNSVLAIILAISSVFITAAVVAAAVWLPKLSYKRRKYLFTEDKIEIVEGIIFVETSMIPISRIQHLTIDEGPLLRKHGLASIVVFTTAGFFKMEGLTRYDAYKIADNLKNTVNIKVRRKDEHDKEAQ